MNARRNGRMSKGTAFERISNHGARAVKKSFVTLGDLITAAYEVSGSADAAAELLSPNAPLARMIGRRIVIA